MTTFKHGFRPRWRRLTVVLGAVLVVGLITGPAAQTSGPKPKFDRKFMTEMVSHHGMAVDMAEMAMEKAEHGKLKKTAEAIVSTQTAEIKQMQKWLKSWYGVTVEPEMTKQDERDMAELEEASGSEFELRFMGLMTVHHTLAIERAGIAKRRAGHDKVRELARGIVAAQKREVKEFRDWTVAWYAD